MRRTYRAANCTEKYGVSVLRGLEGLVGQGGTIGVDGGLEFSQLWSFSRFVGL